MAYDDELARRIRERIGAERALTERRMFGGLAFLIEGSMTVAVSGQGGLMARVDAEEGVALCERDGVAPMIMNRRPMRGWLRVAPDVVVDDASLDEWVTRCVDYVKGTVNAPGDGAV
jgi:TfoX N-terminal domain